MTKANYEAANQRINFPQMEEEIAKNWLKDEVFLKSVNSGKPEHVFYDGPPFPTGAPHHGTIFVSILKDSLARYFTMASKSVPRRWGWDCHGLPIENLIEKKLGITNKTEIEQNMGIAAFNNACRAVVSEYNDAWEIYISKVGRWVDYRNAYKTMDLSYMESVLWVFKQSHDKGLIYKDYRVTPYCYQCETSLSISDTRESDSTRPKQDPEIIVKFKAEVDLIPGIPTYFLAWTTTPWTLAANLALAVGVDYDYVAVEIEGAHYIMAKELLKIFKKEWGETPKITAEFKGQDLLGKHYHPILPYFKNLREKNYFRIIGADFVTLTDGVGIVHIAPAFGEDDYWACKKEGISVVNPVNAQGIYEEEVTDFKGRNVHECNGDVIRFLKEQGKVLRHTTMVHNYPHCWRCRTPLIYRAMDAWYFAIDKIKPQLLAQAEHINWVPEHVKAGRFGKWLEGARDWNLSRSRYWGTPIPVWECHGNKECHHREVFGSLKELESRCGSTITDLHKEFLDELKFSCNQCKKGTMVRVPEVLDCWFESGAMPYGQCHYPFENKEWFDSHFPADFIVEYPGQIRGWFYYLHVLAVALFNRPAFKNCLVHGTLLAEDGTKISKSKKNYTDPMDLINKYGADALRIYLCASPAATMDDMNFKDSGIEDQIKGVLLPIWNAYSFFVTYANIDGYKGDPKKDPNSSNKLDRWILAKLRDTVTQVGEAFSTYHLNHSLTPVISFLNNLTNWYIRRSRKRFWASIDAAPQIKEDKDHAYDTLYYCLINLAKMLAPSAPFIADKIYRNLTGEVSVHLTSWPIVPQKYHDEILVTEIDLAQHITSLGLALRQQAKLRVRQPLSLLQVALPKHVDTELLLDQIEVIKDELNIKKIEIIDRPEELATIRAKPNAKVLGPKFGKEIQDIIMAARSGQIREQGTSVIVFNDQKEWTLERQDIEIGFEGKPGKNVLSQNGILVSLDTSISEELLEEGICNDLNRYIQEARKDAGFEIHDHIILTLEGQLDKKWWQHLARECLAEYGTLTETSCDKSLEIEIDGRPFRILLKKK